MSLRAARETGHISGLVSLLNAKTGEVQRARPRCLLKGQSAVVEVTPARPICVEDYADYRVRGRVVRAGWLASPQAAPIAAPECGWCGCGGCRADDLGRAVG